MNRFPHVVRLETSFRTDGEKTFAKIYSWLCDHICADKFSYLVVKQPDEAYIEVEYKFADEGDCAWFCLIWLGDTSGPTIDS